MQQSLSSQKLRMRPLECHGAKATATNETNLFQRSELILHHGFGTWDVSDHSILKKTCPQLRLVRKGKTRPF